MYYPTPKPNYTGMNDPGSANGLYIEPSPINLYVAPNSYQNNQQSYPPTYPQPNPYVQPPQPPYTNQKYYTVPRNPSLNPIVLGQQQPTVIVIGKSSNSGTCQYCNSNTSVIQRKRSGCAIWSWCTALFLFTGVCCWIPFVVDDCYDMEYICINCQGVRGLVKSRHGC